MHFLYTCNFVSFASLVKDIKIFESFLVILDKQIKIQLGNSIIFFLTVLTFLTVSPSNGQSGQSGHVIFLSCTFCTFPLQSAIVQIVQCIFFERCVQKLSVSCSYIFLVIINHYRYHLESILVQIAINQQTKPLKIGRKYILSKDKRSIKIQRNDVQCTKEQIGRLNE